MDGDRVANAVSALQKYLKSASSSTSSDKKQLFESDEDAIYLIVKNKKYFGDVRSTKPRLVSLPYNAWGAEKPRVCLFARDPQRAYKDALGPLVDRVVGLTKLRGKFKPYEARRALRSEYDIFIAEEEIIPMLPKLLGTVFYSKQSSVPIPVTVRKGAVINPTRAARTIERVVNSTVVIYPASTNMLVRIGTTAMKPTDISANAASVVSWLEEKATKQLPKGLKSVRSLSIKTKHSPTLPVYYPEELYSESDIGSDSELPEDESRKRVSDDVHLDEILADIVDEEDIKSYNRETKRRRKSKSKSKSSEKIAQK